MIASPTDPNPYLAGRPAAPPTDASLGVDVLSSAQCWRLVERERFGRLAVDGADGRPNIFPINYVVREHVVFLRSAPGSKLRSIAQHPEVAFEVDGEDTGHHWSVVLRGRAERMNVDADIEASGVLALVSASPTAKHNFIRIVDAVASGRRFRVTLDESVPRRQRERPYAIPHVPPIRGARPGEEVG